MTPPIHDREQATRRVLDILCPGWRIDQGWSVRHTRKIKHVGRTAERIVDALGIGTDSEVERAKSIGYQEGIAAVQAMQDYDLEVRDKALERAEERLRVTDEMTDKVHSRLYPHDPESPDWANRKEWWRWKDVQAALRAVLSNVKDKEND